MEKDEEAKVNSIQSNDHEIENQIVETTKRNEKKKFQKGFQQLIKATIHYPSYLKDPSPQTTSIRSAASSTPPPPARKTISSSSTPNVTPSKRKIPPEEVISLLNSSEEEEGEEEGGDNDDINRTPSRRKRLLTKAKGKDVTPTRLMKRLKQEDKDQSDDDETEDFPEETKTKHPYQPRLIGQPSPTKTPPQKKQPPQRRNSKKPEEDDDDEGRGGARRDEGNKKKKETLTLLVVVRGDITDRIYQTWKLQLPKRILTHDYIIEKDYHGEEKGIVVISSNCSGIAFAAWIGEHNSTHKLGLEIQIVSSEWVIQAIKHSVLPVIEEYLLPNPLDALEMEIKEQEHQKELLGEEVEEGGKIRKKGPFHPSYACIQTGDIKTLNPNKYITDILEELQNIYELCGDEWRALGYKKCIGTLKQLPRITNIEQLKGVRGVGDSIRDKIHEILQTGKLQKLKHFKDDPKIQSMMELSKIWGVGEKTALKLMRQGFKSIKDLRERGKNVLTYQQKIGLKYYEEFMKKMPRAEIEEILRIVQEHCTR